MGCEDRQLRLLEAMMQIEVSIAPSNVVMLDVLLEASALARPGIDADSYAGELRRIVAQLEELIRQVEAISPARQMRQPYREASAA